MPNGDIPRRVVVKFRDAIDLPYEDGANRHLERRGDESWKELADRFRGIRLDRLFTVVPPARIRELVSQAVDRDRHYRAPNFLSFFVIDSPADVDPNALSAALREWPDVETAYVDPSDRSPAPPNTNPFYAQQTYLKPPAVARPPAPQGAIDAEFAWAQPGGTGANQKFIDLERGLDVAQLDIATRNIQTLAGINPIPPQTPEDLRDLIHGAKVLCVVAGVDNLLGVIGIAYGVQEVAHTCQVTNGGIVNRPDAVFAAIDHFPQGDAFGRVLLLEVELGSNPADADALRHMNGAVWLGMPMETVLADYEAIRLATALGIVVVEAAGNGDHDLDLFQQKISGQFVLARNGGRPDSGAILVGGSTANYPYDRVTGGGQGSCFGSRVDCFAWSMSVMTYDPTALNGYAATFGGTSSASAIVAGAVLLVEGVAEATLNQRLSPGRLRALLSDRTAGVNTPSNAPAVDRIGVMPNLKNILQDQLGVAPDVYMRDYVGDNGLVHAGAISMSPDIIVRPALVANPGVTFGPGTENDLSLGSIVIPGQDNFVYVRVWNRATDPAAAATNVKATVFYAQVATLLTGDAWNRIGEVTINNVPPGNVMTVSGPILWPSANLPAPGHYCFIGLVGNDRDPAPGPANFLDFDRYFAYIRNNNNVTWRNFNVMALPPPAPPEGLTVDGADKYEFQFAVPGAPDSERNFQLAFGAELPADARVWLEAPLALLHSLHLPVENTDADRKTGQIVIDPRGRTVLPAVLLPAKFRAPCRLLIHMPRAFRGRTYDVFASQLYNGFEVGRVTWRISGKPGEKPR